MSIHIPKALILSLLLLSCHTGKLKVVANIPDSLKETSACEVMPNSKLIWVIEDAGNKNNLYGLDQEGYIIKDIDINNAENEDWEDLTSDNSGNIYIGDFGNNNEKREKFAIYKVSNPETKTESTTAEIINFNLPKDLKSKDFESFFLLDGYFYIFSKETKKCILIKVPNLVGSHTAELVTDFNLDGKHNKITSADISDDGETVVLLNHEKLWKLSNFKPDAFFKGKVEELEFEHDSQKEGVSFIDNHSVLITDEKNGVEGGNIYSFKIN